MSTGTTSTILHSTVPVLWYLLSVISFSLPVNSPASQRWMFLPLLLIPAYLSLTTADRLPQEVASLWGLTVCIYSTHAISVLFFEPITLPFENHKRYNGSWLNSRFWNAWRMWNNPRLLGTSRQVSGVHYSSETLSTSWFLFTRLVKLALYYLLVEYVQPRIFPGAFAPLTYSEVDPAHEMFFRRLFGVVAGPDITSREFGLKSTLALLWAWLAIVELDAAHAALSVLFVGVLRIDRPDDWPPLFGPISKAYSIRCFWSDFWHRVVVRPYINYGEAVSRRILGNPPGSRMDKMVVNSTVFFLSGIMHSVVSWQLGDRCGWWLDTWWFMANFAAAAVETIAVEQFKQISKRSGSSSILNKMSSGSFGQVLGYIWVFMFFFWSVPKWYYPRMYCPATM